MRTIVEKTITHRTQRHDFDNEFAYIEHWNNNHLRDNYFAAKDDLHMDGSVKEGCIKYFYSPFFGEEVEKEIEPVKWDKFKWFDKLYYFGEEGEIYNISGQKASEMECSLN